MASYLGAMTAATIYPGVSAGRLAGGVLVGVTLAGLCAALAAVLLLGAGSGSSCALATATGVAGSAAIAIAATGGGPAVGATEYGGPGDPSSGTVGAAGVDLARHPDSYAELGGSTFATATAMGGLAYMTPLRVSWGGRSAVAYKRDIGRGGGPVDGMPRVIDLWWQLASALGIPYEGGRWSGTVRLSRPSVEGAASLLGAAPGSPVGTDPACPSPGVAPVPVPVAPGPRAVILAGGVAAAPAGAPAQVRGILAAGNQIAGRPYVYGAAHGFPLDRVAPAYDCSSSVEHLLYGGSLLPAGFGAASSALESFGLPGPGRWVTIYANPDHVFLYVAGLRWDTWNAGGPSDGTTGIGWHPLVRDAAGFVARHPVGL